MGASKLALSSAVGASLNFLALVSSFTQNVAIIVSSPIVVQAALEEALALRVHALHRRNKAKIFIVYYMR